jgi:hypothetical protein
MAAAIGLPDEGESGTKLIRRSMTQLLRHRGVPDAQLAMMLGHRAIKSTSELRAPFSPVFLADARTAIEAIFVEIETLAPGALRRTCAANDAEIIPHRRAEKWLKSGRKNGGRGKD